MTNKKNGKRFITRSSGNVFADLGLPNAEEEKTKVRLAFEINQIIENRGQSQIMAARRLKINQPKISALSNYRLDGFSVERLMNFLTALDRDVEIIIRRRPKSGKAGRISVIAA
jgi:predicted XRE-type DNA-binding protein